MISLASQLAALKLLRDRGAFAKLGLPAGQAELLERQLGAAIATLEWLQPRAERIRDWFRGEGAERHAA